MSVDVRPFVGYSPSQERYTINSKEDAKTEIEYNEYDIGCNDCDYTATRNGTVLVAVIADLN